MLIKSSLLVAAIPQALPSTLEVQSSLPVTASTATTSPSPPAYTTSPARIRELRFSLGYSQVQIEAFSISSSAAKSLSLCVISSRCLVSSLRVSSSAPASLSRRSSSLLLSSRPSFTMAFLLSRMFRYSARSMAYIPSPVRV